MMVSECALPPPSRRGRLCCNGQLLSPFAHGQPLSPLASLSAPGQPLSPKMGRSPLPDPASPGLDVAGPSGKCSDTDWCDHRTLDFPNDKLKKDSTGSHPYLRLTGVAVSDSL